MSAIRESARRPSAHAPACGSVRDRLPALADRRGPVHVVELGEEEVDTSRDARSYIATDTVTPVVRASITINGGQVLRADVSADNAIMHLIDKVLIPPFAML